jgi:hypothetical protein
MGKNDFMSPKAIANRIKARAARNERGDAFRRFSARR